MDEELKRLGFVAPTIEKRLFSIKRWSKNNIANDYIYSISNSIDNIEAASPTARKRIARPCKERRIVGSGKTIINGT